jgi:peptidyl-prolyl cis-trans isomerase A (cyclophilin A)
MNFLPAEPQTLFKSMSKNLLCCLSLIGALLLAGCVRQSLNVKKVSMPQDQEKSTQEQGNAGSKGSTHPGLKDPAMANLVAPETYRVKFETTKGNFVVEVTRDWSPNGADRFYNLVDIGYFENIAIFRAIKGFMFQFGIHGNPAINEIWREANIPDDKRKGISNRPGTLTFAHAGPNTRGTQLFVNLGSNNVLDPDFTPIGKVVEGMDVVSTINTEYGENSDEVQGRFQAQGNAYISKRYPNLDYIKSIKLLEKEGEPQADGKSQNDQSTESKPESKG